MFSIGGGEFLVIALIALIVLGPQRLPDAARQVGKAMGELRRLSTGFQKEFKDAIVDPEATRTAVPRRDVLGHPSDSNPAVTAAVSSDIKPRSTRRPPLKAAPAVASTRVNGTSRTQASGAKTTASKKPAPATKAPSAKTSTPAGTAKKVQQSRGEGS